MRETKFFLWNWVGTSLFLVRGKTRGLLSFALTSHISLKGLVKNLVSPLTLGSTVT